MGKTNAGAAGVLLLAALLGHPPAATAATRSFSLAGLVTATNREDPAAPDFTGTIGTGTFAFDVSRITGAGNEVIGGGDLAIDFTIFGQRFGQADDATFDDFPRLLLRDGTPRALDFAVSEIGANPVALLEPFLVTFFTDPLFEFRKLGPGSFATSITAVSATPVPLPAALPLALGGAAILGLLGLRRRRRLLPDPDKPATRARRRRKP